MERAANHETPGRPGPAVSAARQQGRVAPYEAGEPRGYPPVPDPDDATGDAVALAAKQALVTAESRTAAARVLHTAVNDLGGAVVPARLAGSDAMPVDVSLGVGEPQVVVIDPIHPASLRLGSHLPTLVQDALSAAARCDRRQRLRHLESGFSSQ